MAPPKLFRRVLNRRHDAGSNTLAASIVAEYLSSGVWAHCDEQNATFKHKRDLLCRHARRDTSRDRCRWSEPAGGLFLWLRLPDDVDRDRLQSLADQRGFRYARGRAFQVDNEDVPFLRLAFGHVPDEMIDDGIPVLARVHSRSANVERTRAPGIVVPLTLEPLSADKSSPVPGTGDDLSPDCRRGARFARSYAIQ